MYGFSQEAEELLLSFLANRRQKAKWKVNDMQTKG